MDKLKYREIRLDLATHHTLRKLAAAWQMSMLATVAHLVAEAWAAEQRKEQEQRDPGVHHPMRDTEDSSR